ncbi:MarR family winged helix-turn-helix transcriptional regulator [Cryobacterium sp. N22]|uniref:MarR family winged helix-turn-helix transcriptional regulator n=1 Tax=Cryobacterium sp. N22 TaxID=2048290 RepID=UPI00130499FB|nr:MarR family transcriptional regulator [Cryobacterium sp. N22]
MTELESRAWLCVVSVGQLLTPALDARLRAAGVTTFELGTLVLLTENAGGPLRISEIATSLYATLPHISKVVGKLEGRGLVERAPSLRDARASSISVTESGRRLVADASPIYSDEARTLLLNRLGPEQVAVLVDILEPFVQALAPNHPQRAAIAEGPTRHPAQPAP